MRTPAWRQELTRGRSRRYSVFPLGLRLLTRWLALGRGLCYDLWLFPHLPRCLNLKNVVC
jgi:hypothetical protein